MIVATFSKLSLGYVQGFVEGAQEVWEEVKDQL